MQTLITGILIVSVFPYLCHRKKRLYEATANGRYKESIFKN